MIFTIVRKDFSELVVPILLIAELRVPKTIHFEFEPCVVKGLSESLDFLA